MKIEVNGESLEVAEGCTLAALVALQQVQGRRIAIEVNGELVTRSQHESHCLKAGDRVEIVQAIGGG